MDRDFARIVNSYGDMLFRLCMHYTRNIADAEDIVQQSFLKIIEKNVQFKNPVHEKAWLIRVCTNLCLDMLKRADSNTLPLTDQPAGAAAQPQDSCITESLYSLPPKQRTAIYLFYYEDMSVKEIALAMDEKQNTVLSHLNRGRKALEKLLKEEM